ncbi:protein CDV3 homolog [Lineus longissimus]|uniref:protein CDV3 homolog n=1 Tax=Lineus longissimus TaxID=88925 RepID=UPI002B4DF6E7
MADDDGLDDFFAKKDKKGKSKKNKFVAADLLEDGKQPLKSEKPKKKKKPKEKSDESNVADGTKKEEEEEWIEVDNEEVNYSGLKIKTLQIVDESEQDRENQEQAEDEDGETAGIKSTHQGPWAGVVQSQTPTESAPLSIEAGDQPSEETAEKKDEPAKAPTKYIPPGLRKAMMEEANSPVAPVRRGKPRAAPDIQSEMHFPTLGGTSDVVDRHRDKEFERENPKSRFETVRGGNRQLEDSSKHGLELEIENKFDLLQDNN